MGTSPPKTTEWAFDTYIGAAIATNTTLATATRYDFPALTVYVPEGSPTFLSAFVEVRYRDASATASNHQGHRIGLKLGAGAFTDYDVEPFSPVVGSTGDHEALLGYADVTAQVAAQWTGTSMSVQVGFAARQAAARAVQNITAKLVLTYTHDDTLVGSPTRSKTIRIPLQSHSTTLTTVAQEVGTDGTSPAPANQIPALDTFLPESGKVYRRCWLAVEGNDNSSATTDIALEVQIDATAAQVRCLLEQVLATCVYFADNVPYDTATHSPASAHAFKAYCATTNRFRWLYAVLYVTYEYDETNTRAGRVMNEQIIPAADLLARYTPGTSTANADRLRFPLHVGEPGTITLVQSAILIDWHNPSSGDADLFLWADGQSEREYDGHNAGVSGGEWPLCHRVDHASSTWTLAAGENELFAHIYADSNNDTNAQHTNSAIAIINYTSDCHPDGTHVHSSPTLWFGAGAGTATGGGTSRVVVAAASQDWPTLPAHYRISAFYSQIYLRENNAITGTIGVSLVSGEDGYPGKMVTPFFLDSDSETGWMSLASDWTPWCRLTDQEEAGGVEVDTARELICRLNGTSTTAHFMGMIHVLSSHSCEYDVAGTVSGYTGDGSGIDVDVYRVADRTRVASAVTAVGGGYTAKVYDPSAHFAVARQDATHVGRSDNVTPA